MSDSNLYPVSTQGLCLYALAALLGLFRLRPQTSIRSDVVTPFGMSNSAARRLRVSVPLAVSMVLILNLFT
jgi:hypothetical protein